MNSSLEKEKHYSSKRSLSSHNSMKEDSLARSPNTSITKLKFRRNMMKESLENSVEKKPRENSNESLERIHTFSLKNSFSKTNTELEKELPNSSKKPNFKSSIESLLQ